MTVSISKGQTVSLVKPDGTQCTQFHVGLGWDAAKRGRNIDLDASAMVMDGNRCIATAWYGGLTCQGVTHMGDNLTGDGDGDDEVIEIYTDRLPANTTSVVITINSYSGQKFTDVKNAYARIVDLAGNELVRFSLTDSEKRTGVYMAVILKTQTGWSVRALGVFKDGRNVNDMMMVDGLALPLSASTPV